MPEKEFLQKISNGQTDIVKQFLGLLKKLKADYCLNSSKSDLRIQLQTDPRYQGFLAKASIKKILGYSMRVAAVEDVLQGKIWAYMDGTRRFSKRQKDLADIFRLVEKMPELISKLPERLKKMI